MLILSFSKPLKFLLFNVFVFFLFLFSGIVYGWGNCRTLVYSGIASLLFLPLLSSCWIHPTIFTALRRLDRLYFHYFLQPPQKLAVVRMRNFFPAKCGWGYRGGYTRNFHGNSAERIFIAQLPTGQCSKLQANWTPQALLLAAWPGPQLESAFLAGVVCKVVVFPSCYLTTISLSPPVYREIAIAKELRQHLGFLGFCGT